MKKLGTIYFLAGKMAAGKSTYAEELSKETNAVIVSEDDMLSSLFPGEVKNIEDYIHYSLRIKPYVQQLVYTYIDRGIDVIMDFPGNTKRQRKCFKELIHEKELNHTLLYIKAEDDVCLKHLEQRRLDEPSRNHFDSEEVFFKMKEYFEEADSEEGFNITVIPVT